MSCSIWFCLFIVPGNVNQSISKQHCKNGKKSAVYFSGSWPFLWYSVPRFHVRYHHFVTIVLVWYASWLVLDITLSAVSIFAQISKVAKFIDVGNVNKRNEKTWLSASAWKISMQIAIDSICRCLHLLDSSSLTSSVIQYALPSALMFKIFVKCLVLDTFCKPIIHLWDDSFTFILYFAVGRVVPGRQYQPNLSCPT